MADLETSFQFVMTNEDSTLSGVVTPEPHGGEARFGVNSIAHPEAVAAGLYTTMSRDEAWDYAKALFTGSYWNKVQGDGITSQVIANKTVDLAYDLSPEAATKIVQRAVNSLYIGPLVLMVDGDFGQKTLMEVNDATATDLLAAILNYGEQYYRDIANRNPDLAQYLTSWLNRLKRV